MPARPTVSARSAALRERAAAWTRRLRRGAYGVLRAAADACDPDADLAALRNVERRVFTPQALGAPTAQLRYVFIGLCQIGKLADVRPELGCTVEHLLYDSSAYGEAPAPDPARYDAAVVALTLRTLLNEACGRNADLEMARDDWDAARAAEVLAQVLHLIDLQLERLAAPLAGLPTFVFSFLEPSFSYLGGLAPESGLDQPGPFVRRLNAELGERLAHYPHLHLYDVNDAFNMVGRLHLQDDIVSTFSHSCIIGTFDEEMDTDRLVAAPSNHRIYDVASALPVLQSYVFRSLGDAMAILRQSDPIKLIIVDLDDTLWRGVAAESELLSWRQTEGWPSGFAEALLYFKRRGGLLAICSKNEREPTLERFAFIWGGRLRLEDFVSIQIGWASKAEGVRAILQEVNLLPESTLFVDDNPRELAEVSAALPGLRCLGGNHRDWRRIVLRAPQTRVAAISGESARRTELVRAQIGRSATAPQVQDRGEWLASLGLEETLELIESARAPGFARALELLNKTNQFNTTGRRWSAAELGTHLAQGGVCLTASLRDATLDNGVVGVAVLAPGEIVQVVLSCRVFGLGAELALGALATQMALCDRGRVTARTVDSGRNLSSRDYYARLGFTAVEDVWATQAAPEPPAWIELTLSAALRVRLERSGR